MFHLKDAKEQWTKIFTNQEKPFTPFRSSHNGQRTFLGYSLKLIKQSARSTTTSNPKHPTPNRSLYSKS
jgi:hypothetical protein